MGKVFDEKSVTLRNQIYEIPEGTIILREGERNLDMYKILSGHVEMYTGYGTENEVLLGILCPGSCFGEFGILTKKPAIYTIISFSKIKLLRITEELLNDFMRDNPGNVIQIMTNMANNMLMMQQEIAELSNVANELSQTESAITRNSIKNMLKNYAIFENNRPKNHFEPGTKMYFMDEARRNQP
ncbi:Crp/Fnr family transcriptional regulator [Butyrivibrio sp.]|jgi:CRP-like cAMP-binding protein|uniref:Crp/Fnr family transcriptional regulator n=1 Tax=Butyrivibrio sp. TaxID=28121 RepID=UPI0025C69EF6|nr:cyclic nucleotide-binding domain-containing protein [Butyrivibrio sp.]MBE5838357.1 cyclic nucleotide-binding domain-containing protein [Butyrivibrio sp.]